MENKKSKQDKEGNRIRIESTRRLERVDSVVG